MLSNDGRESYTIGEIVNLMSTDAYAITDFFELFNTMWSTPLQIGIAFYLLWQRLGIATVPGLIFMIILMPINGVITRRLRSLDESLSKLTDKRIKPMNEILSGIRVWKMYAWEQAFNAKIIQLWESEDSYRITRAFYRSFIGFTYRSAQVLVSPFENND